jgi:K319-like protein
MKWFYKNRTNYILSKKRGRSEAGFSYMAILILLAILSTLTFSFLFKTGTQTQATVTRGQSMQAHYLAETAANHAIWRMLNEPGFDPAADTYTMHSLANGRYGYKVRMPTETTFATVATVGAIEDSVVNQSYVQYIFSNVLSAYARTTTPTVQYRRLIGAKWTDPADTPDIPVPTVYWVEMEGCPVRKEIIMGSIDGQDDINLVVWDGASWGNPHTLGQDANKNHKCFDIAYESQSGDALVVGRTDVTTMVRYNVWDGTSWLHATAQPAFSIAGGVVKLVTMASCPGNDDILIATVDSNDDIRVVHWDGNAFHDQGGIVWDASTQDYGVVQIVYETQSGDALVVWGEAGVNTIRYRVWDGATVSALADVPGIDKDVHVLRVAADPTSDHIVVAGIDKFYDIHVAVWDGDAWIDSREIETLGANYSIQCFDIAWEASGEDAVVVYSHYGDTNMKVFPWKRGTLLADSTIQTGPDFQGKPWLIRLLPISKSEKIVCLGTNDANELRYCLWTGEQLKGDPAVLLEPSIPVAWDIAFDLAEANVPRSGGIGTGGGGASGNDPPVVNAGPDKTIYLPDNDANVDGTVTDDGLPSSPGFVTTIWSMVSGPGTVTFGDASLVDTTATFSDPGEYVLRLTADDGSDVTFDEVTIIVDSCALLLVVADASSLSSSETARKTLIEGWGWTVYVISDHATQGEFDAATAIVDVVYIPSVIDSAALGGKLRETVVGVVIEKQMSDFGIATDWESKSRNEIKVIDNSHYITSPFDVGMLTYLSSLQPVTKINGGYAPGLNTLAEMFNIGTLWKPALGVIETGGELAGGGTAAGRRVQLPWGDGTFNFNALTVDGTIIMKRAIEWAAQKEGGCGGVGACSADYTPDTNVGQFSTIPFGSYSHEGVTYLPEGKSFNLTAVPAGGALIIVEISNMLYMTDMTGNFLTSLATPSGSTTGITLVQAGTWANHLAISDKHNDEIKYLDLSGNFINSFSTDVSADFDATNIEDVAFIGFTTSGIYNNHLAIADQAKNKVFLVDQNGGWVSSIDLSGIMTNVKGLVHLPETDKLLLVNSTGQAYIVDLAGNLLYQYDTTLFGTSSAAAITINPLTCDHLVGDPSSDLIVTLNLLGSGDTDPPTPDPMTWSTPPVAVDPSSITMTATTASDSSGVEYYVECTAGGGNDSGWQDSPAYVDSGLSPNTSYTYRVKARDKSANQNETGWSTEASGTTLSNEIYVYDIAMGFRPSGVNYFGQATVWIKSVGGANISDAVVSGEWSGSVSGTSMGSTGSDGKVMLESPSKKNGGTFMFTVTGVVKTGYTYNPSLNVEDSDTIIAP